MTYKKYEYLCGDAEYIRKTVFMKEQGFRNEIDDTDKTAVHLVFYDGEKPAAVCRYFADKNKSGVFHIGRVAVLKEFRGGSIGRAVMEAAENEIIKDGGTKVIISAQIRVSGFYAKCGYTAFGEEYLDEFCPHISMVKEFSCK